ncbi:hypothetical protein FRC10_007801, partial [Ceratobasidium sp. 414]
MDKRARQENTGGGSRLVLVLSGGWTAGPTTPKSQGVETDGEWQTASGQRQVAEDGQQAA